MGKTRKKNNEVEPPAKSTSDSGNDLEAPELQPISVWAQQIKEKLKTSTYQATHANADAEPTTPLASIVQKNTVARMARVLKEKMQAFNSDLLLTTSVDSSEVTLSSPVPMQDAPESREKLVHSYQRSYPAPKKRREEEEDSDGDETAASIGLWLQREMDTEERAEDATSHEERPETKTRRKRAVEAVEEKAAKKKSKENPKKKAQAKKKVAVKRKPTAKKRKT